jgi:hypothetical protein
VLAKEGKEVILADADLPPEAISKKLATVDYPTDGLGADTDLLGDLFDAVEALNLRGGIHGFGSWLAVGEVDERDRIASMAAWRPSRRARAARDPCFAESGRG